MLAISNVSTTAGFRRLIPDKPNWSLNTETFYYKGQFIGMGMFVDTMKFCSIILHVGHIHCRDKGGDVYTTCMNTE